MKVRETNPPTRNRILNGSLWIILQYVGDYSPYSFLPPQFPEPMSMTILSYSVCFFSLSGTKLLACHMLYYCRITTIRCGKPDAG
jgi:hypothetical protein